MGGFPGRPSHPDMQLLSRAVLDLDARADAAGKDVTGILARYVSPDAAIYVALQRAEQVLARRPRPGTVLVAAAWLDGFAAAMIVQNLRDQADPDRESRGT